MADRQQGQHQPGFTEDPIWRRLPHYYDYHLSYATMLAEQVPFHIGFANIQVNQPMPVHWHDAFEIGYVLEGRGIFVLEGQETLFQPGHVHVINGADRHMAYAFEHARFFNIHFHPDLLRDTSFSILSHAARRPFIAGPYRFKPLLPPEHSGTAHIVALLEQIAHEHSHAAPNWQIIVKGLLLQTIGMLLRHFESPMPFDVEARRLTALRARLAPALQLIERRLTERLTIAELAAAVALSSSHFSALFAQALDTSPLAYRNARRMALAQQLLEESDAPIGDIATRCGFEAVQQFNRLFRRIVGCTPIEYRYRTAHDQRIGSEVHTSMPPQRSGVTVE